MTNKLSDQNASAPMKSKRIHFKNLPDEELKKIVDARYVPLRNTMEKIAQLELELKSLRKLKTKQEQQYINAAHWITSRKIRKELGYE